MHVRTQIGPDSVVSEDAGEEKKLSGLTEQGGFGIKQENQMTLASAWSDALNLERIQDGERDGWRGGEQKSRPMPVVNFHMNGRFNISLGKGSSRRLGPRPEVQSSPAHTPAEDDTHTHTRTHCL